MNCSAGSITITSPASIVISSDLSPLIKSLYRSKLKVFPLLLISLMLLKVPISDIPPEYAKALDIVLKGFTRYVPGALTAPTIVIFLALRFLIDTST